MAKNLRVFKGAGCPDLDKQTLALLVKFLKYAINELKLQDVEVKIRLLGKSPNEPITTGCYSPQNKTISTICDGRHMIDYCRTIAHELTHMKQDVDNRINGNEQEIGGKIENEANMVAGIVMKKFIKNILTKEDKQHLGLGFYGS
jgi:hypothetical protein